MNEQEKQEYLEQYKKEKAKGVPFFPDIIFKDAVVSIIIFLVLIALAFFIGAALEAKADPSDSSYTPRPEWYFLFLFQLLKYFPGQLEVIGVVVLPTLMILLLFFLPFLDRSSKRHFSHRLVFIGITLFLGVGIIYLTVQSVLEAPPPAEAASGDQTALLYTRNCATCHGPTISVQPGTNLHDVIAQGKHEGMPAWSGDLSSDQIDALVGFILSPGGSTLFTQACSQCHELQELVESNPLELKTALEQGLDYPQHANIKPEDWSSDLDKTQQTQLINFLIAPDGRRLYSVYCASCHGSSIAFSGDQAQLEAIIKQGGMHLEMPAWNEKLSAAEIDQLANYVVNPSANPGAAQLFEQNCATCHGDRIPASTSVEQAKETIASGGPHQTMPVWGQILTEEQVTALAEYSFSTAQGSSIEVGQTLFSQACSPCHGEFGEGGLNPTRANDIIFPISTGEYLKTRDDFTIASIIAQGQPNSGMSPFGSAYGGPLDEDQINDIVAYIRSWEANPPVELPPEFNIDIVSLSGSQIYADICAQCHGPAGEGGVGPIFASRKFQQEYSDEDLFKSISQGHPGSPMIGWASVLTNDQIKALIDFIRKLPLIGEEAAAEPTKAPATNLTFVKDVLPVFKEYCSTCHGSMGGWDASSYNKVMQSGNNGPTVLPGNPDGSLLIQKLRGTQTIGALMPPAGKLSDDVIQTIVDWVAAGAKEK